MNTVFYIAGLPATTKYLQAVPSISTFVIFKGNRYLVANVAYDIDKSSYHIYLEPYVNGPQNSIGLN